MFFLGFSLIIMGVLGIIFSLTQAALRYLLEGRSLHRMRYLLLTLDALLLLLLLFAWRRHDETLSGYIVLIASILLMAQLICSVLVLLTAAVRGIWRCIAAQPVDAHRRRILAGAIGYPLFASAAGLYGGLWERDRTVTRHFDIPIAGIDDDLDGYCIAQVSDVHLGSHFSLERLEQLLTQIAASRPDALVITGDLFDSVAMNDAAVAIVDRFTAQFPDGIYFCWGNHEYYRNQPHIAALLQKTRIHVLQNANACIRDGTVPLYFAGVDYPMDRAHFEEQERAYAEEAFREIPENAATVLLAHHSIFIDDGRAHGARLVLTGHTHGGQIGLFGIPLLPLHFKYMRGVYESGNCFGYVHSGNGSWFPYRLGCPPETAYFTLRKK